MSKIRDAVAIGRKFHIEEFDSAMEVAETCKSRKITDGRFDDVKNERFENWRGVKSYDEALEFLKTGYQPTVEKLRTAFKVSKSGEGTRFSFLNQIQGFAPVVPLALKGVPNCMINMQMKPIKAKVIDVYYDMTASAKTDSKDIIKAGQKILSAVIELERQGYRFNLFAIQTYADSSSCDMLAVRVKRDSQPLDLKRISFPMTHTAFFRVIGFDWYSKVPGGKYRGGYGHAISYDFSTEKLNVIAKTLFGKNAIYMSAVKVLGQDEEHIKEVLTNGNSKG